MKDIAKGRKKAEQLYKKACKERDKKGYRENLGYDQIFKLNDYLEKFDLTYSEECQITDYFFKLCDSI